MSAFPARTLRTVSFMVILLILLLGCGSKLTQENFDKIQNGMSMAEVKSILGEPAEAQSVGLGPFSGVSATWKDKKTVINIHFVNDKVTLKTLNKTS